MRYGEKLCHCEKTHGIQHFRSSNRKKKYYRPKKTILQKFGSLIDESYVDWIDSFIGRRGAFSCHWGILEKKDWHGAHISIKFFLLTEIQCPGNKNNYKYDVNRKQRGLNVSKGNIFSSVRLDPLITFSSSLSRRIISMITALKCSVKRLFNFLML